MPPSGHGIGLGQRTRITSRSRHSTSDASEKLRSGVIQVHVALVGDHPDAALGGHATDFGLCSGDITAPDGFDGEFRMIILVRGGDHASHHLRGDAEALAIHRFQATQEHRQRNG